MKLAIIPDDKIRKNINQMCRSLDADLEATEPLKEISPLFKNAYCPRCKKIVRVKFRSHQYSKGVKIFDLYECTTPNCNDTISLNETGGWVEEHRGL